MIAKPAAAIAALIALCGVCASAYAQSPAADDIARKFSDAADKPSEAAAPTDPAAIDAEVQALAERLARIREERAREDAAAASSRTDAAAPERRAHVGTPVPPEIAAPPGTRVTILIVLDVGQSQYRKWSPTADPMLCIHENCFLSNGPDTAADKLSRREAFGPVVALGTRGKACRSKPACIFRDIDLETVEAKLQPVDLQILKHDRREALPIHPDGTCAFDGTRLTCLDPVIAEDWRAWIVPEPVARSAGKAALEAAIADRLGAGKPVSATSQ